jgi:acetolactate synthase-1/2/3 large subunit
MSAVPEVAERYVEALVGQGVECLFLNPGTDTFPIQEALARLESAGRRVPRTVLCPFEVVALAAAHGYYVATGRPQAVLVHVDVGTQNLGGQLHNAQRGRVAVLVSAGRSPYTSDLGARGGRDTYIHWLQEQLDQHGVVRNYTKWDYELRRPDQVGEAVARAFQIAASDPPGPVYLTLPREVLMAPAEPEPGPRRQPPARAGAGDPDALREVARRLVASQRPLVLTATTGRSRAGFEGLRRLAELLALPVVDWRERVNFPTDHPLHQGDDPEPYLAEADVLLVLDHDVPYIPGRGQRPARDSWVAQIDLDPVKQRMPLWSFPLDLAVPADTGRALDLVAETAEALLDAPARDRIERRRARLAADHQRRLAAWQAEALAGRGARPIALAWLGRCLGELAREAPDCLFVDEMVTSNVSTWRYVPAREPESWFGSGGSSLGWGLGAALGVKLARPDRPVVALVGDGCFLFGAPVAALWAAQAQAAPFLVVIFDNARYQATKRPLVGAYPDGSSVRSGRFVGVDLTPTPRYDLIARGVGAEGERVEDPAELMGALRRGLERVRGGQTAVVDVAIA